MNNWSWEEYKNWVANNSQNNYQFLYRGQADSGWFLQPSLYRINPNINLNIYVDNIIPEIHNQLTSKGFEYYNLQDINSFNNFLAKLQHHGFPTPLLDWTYHPFIAVHFALEEFSQTNSNLFSIYAFDYIKWITNNYQPIDLLNPNQFVSTFKPSNFNNPRLITQQSILTMTNVLNIEDYLNNASQGLTHPYLYKININRSEINIINADLFQMGITKEKLFPDLDNICSNLKNNFFPLLPL